MWKQEEEAVGLVASTIRGQTGGRQEVELVSKTLRHTHTDLLLPERDSACFRFQSLIKQYHPPSTKCSDLRAYGEDSLFRI